MARVRSLLGRYGRSAEGKTLDRRENDGPYDKENCRWASRDEQSRNRRYCKQIEFDGETKTAAEWGRQFGIKHGTISQRIRRGWTLQRAATTRTNLTDAFNIYPASFSGVLSLPA